MADDNDYTMNKYTQMWVHTLRCSIEELENRLTALESRKCNCSAASSAGSGGTTTSPSDASSERPKTTPTTSSTTNAPAAAVAADPVSAAIRKLLGLRPDLELLIYDNDGVNFGVRLLDASAEGPAKCVRRRISFDLPFVIESFIAAEVAAAKAKPQPDWEDVEQYYKDESPKPHAETAEEVAEGAVKDVLVKALYCISPREKAMMRECAIAAIKRERGEA